MKRTISLLLAVLMLATVAIGCGKTEAPAETTTAATTANTVDPATTDPAASETELPEETRDLVIEKYNRDFVIYQAGNWGYKDFLAEDMTGEPINDAVYTMLSQVSEEFGVNFTTVDDSGRDSSGQGRGYKAVETMHMSGSQDYDLTSIGCYDVCTLAYTGYLTDLAAIDNISLEKSWYDQKAYDMLNLNGRLYYTTGDAMTLDNNCTYCILFNKTVVEQNKLDDPYQLVRDNKWTYDKFIEMGSVLPADLNGDGIRNRNDAYGVTVWLDSIVGMLHASGGAIAKINDEGKFELTLNTERNIDVLSKWTVAGASELSNFITSDTDETAHRSFTTNNCLFYTRYIGIGAYFRDTDLEYGFLPYPKWDEEQKDYCNTMHAYGTSWMCIPSSVKDVEQSGAIMESLSYYGQKLVNPAYYEITLEGKTIRDEESADMLDIIFETRFFDVGFYYQVGGYNNSLFDMFYGGNSNYGSQFKASERAVAKQLEKIDESFEKLAG
jgi:ABC-type glycerol-3-phosphate transport system substrate-binding protein